MALEGLELDRTIPLCNSSFPGSQRCGATQSETLTEDLYAQSKEALLQNVIYLYIVELSSWHVDQCLICSFVLTWYITQSIFHMPSAKWKWLKFFLLKPMAQHITVPCIKCDLTNILLLCLSQNRGCGTSDASYSLVPGIWACGCTLKPHLWIGVLSLSKKRWNHLERIWSVVHCVQFPFHTCVFLHSPLT